MKKTNSDILTFFFLQTSYLKSFSFYSLERDDVGLALADFTLAQFVHFPLRLLDHLLNSLVFGRFGYQSGLCDSHQLLELDILQHSRRELCVASLPDLINYYKTIP